MTNDYIPISAVTVVRLHTDGNEWSIDGADDDQNYTEACWTYEYFDKAISAVFAFMDDNGIPESIPITIAGEPVSRTDRHHLEVASVRHRIAEQRKWIDEHGVSRVGYLLEYGPASSPDRCGDGGEAIYEADINELHRLEALLNRLTKAEEQ